MTETRIMASAVVRPTAGEGVGLVAQMAAQALNQACEACDVTAKQIGLIVTLSISPSHQGVRAEIVGPRFGYVVQRELAIDGAFVLDLIDNDWAFALDQTILFARAQGIRYAALLRGENLTRLKTPHRAFSDGAAALLLEIGNDLPEARYASLGFAPFLTVTLDGEAARMHDHGLPSQLPDAAAALMAREGSDRLCMEAWVPNAAPPSTLPPGDDDDEGIFAVPRFLSGAAPGRYTIVSLDPFKARLGRIVLPL